MAELLLENVTVAYRRNGYELRVLDELNAHIPDGQLALLVGPSGSGKTTLFSCIAGLMKPTSGRICVSGEDVASLDTRQMTQFRRDSVGVIFQAFNLIPSLNALENVAIPLIIAGKNKRESYARATELLELVDLGDRLKHAPSELSGGQQQRVAIARALVHEPALVLADEPTAHLDYIQVEEILSLIRRIAAPGRIVVVATHDDRFKAVGDMVIDLAPRAHALAPLEPAKTLDVEQGDILFVQGDRADFIYTVEEGAIEIYRQRTDGGKDILAMLGPGDYFGELGVLISSRRSASARAVLPARLSAHTAEQFQAWLASHSSR